MTSEAGDAGREHPASRDAGRVGEPPDRLPDDPGAEDDEDERVRERGQHLGPPPAEAALGRRRAVREPGREEGEPERERIREHVRRVGEQRERPGHEPGGRLDSGEAEHEHEGRRQRPFLSGRARARRHRSAARLTDLFMIAAWQESRSRVSRRSTRTERGRSTTSTSEIEDGEFMVLVGPSGCGKTTALRMVAGLEDISEGQLKIGDRVVNHVPPRDRDIAMVFQSYALYPHLTVYDNIAFGLKLKKMPKERDRQARAGRGAGARPRALPRSASRARSPAASASGSRWAARSCASRRRS